MTVVPILNGLLILILLLGDKYTTRIISQVGEGLQLITGRSWVRVLYDPSTVIQYGRDTHSPFNTSNEISYHL